MSYFEIGVYHPKYETNIGTLWRSAYQMGASGIFVVGNRKVCKQRQASDTMNAGKLIPKRCYISVDALLENGPVGVPLIGVEMGGVELTSFDHPKQAIYLLGAEDHGLPGAILRRCQKVIAIPSERSQSYNVSVAGSIVMFHRMLQMGSGSHAQET